ARGGGLAASRGRDRRMAGPRVPAAAGHRRREPALLRLLRPRARPVVRGARRPPARPVLPVQRRGPRHRHGPARVEDRAVTGPGARSSANLQDAASYDGVGEAFDRLSDRFSAPLARRLLEAAEVGPGDHVLDVGTGTGVVAFPAAARVGPEGTVLGIDISEEMLATARARAARMLEPGHVTFRIMDTQTLALPDASFDVAVSLFAVHHLPDPLAAFREMHRVVRPGGRLAVAVGSGPPLLSAAAVVRGFQ